jgi:hypothetical protein
VNPIREYDIVSRAEGACESVVAIGFISEVFTGMEHEGCFVAVEGDAVDVVAVGFFGN